MTRSFSLSMMSGNFDFPPASSHSISQSRTNEDPYLEGLIHGMASSERNQRRSVNSANASVPSNTRRHRLREEALQEEIRRRRVAVASLASPNAQAMTSAIRSQPRALQSVRHLHRHISRQQETSNLPANADSLQQAVARLNEASSSLGSLLDQPVPTLGSPDIRAREYSGEAEVNRRRAKRRKVDGAIFPPSKAFSYGHRGQVVPGPLKMEIFSCDGDLHEDTAHHGRGFWPENVLIDDESIYCTQSNKCNIIMCHRGETAFCLKKIVIKASERGFTTPYGIQEGLIFISMRSEDLLSRTARYEVREPILPRIFTSEDITNDAIPPPVISSRESYGNRPPSRRTDDSIERAIPPPITDVRAFLPEDLSQSSPFLGPGLGPGDNSSPARTIATSNIPSFTITTDHSDNSSDEEVDSDDLTAPARYPRGAFSPRHTSSEEDTEEGNLSRWATNRARTFGLTQTQRRTRRRANPGRVAIVAPSAGETPSNTDEKSGGNSEILIPHARFLIDQHKSMISIKFDPLVSGRYILLKMWNPMKDQNINIQSIVVHGFGGPRFFPSAQLM